MFNYWGIALKMVQYYKKKATFARNITKKITSTKIRNK